MTVSESFMSKHGSMIPISIQDVCIGFLLTCVYSVTPGFQYSTGLLQAAWLDAGLVSPSFASFINSVTFNLTSIPAPFVQRIFDKLGLKSNAIILIAFPFLLGGTIMSSYSTHPYALLAGNGFLLGFGCCVQLIGSWTGLYYIFADNQIYLFNGCMLAGAGIGLIPISMIFYFVEPVYGWRVAQRMTSVLFLGTVVFVISLLYPVRKCIGIKTRDEKYEEVRKRVRSDSEHSLLLPGVSTNGHENHEKDSIDSNEANEQVFAVGSIVVSSTHSSDVGVLGPLKYAFRHYGYVLVLVSFVFSCQAFDTAMVQQPVRMKTLGIAKKQGALALAINGSVQLVIRVSVGMLCSWGVITPIRFSQIAKLTFIVTTFASIYLTDALSQTIYYFSLGFGGAVLNTADFFLVKEALKKHREFAVTLQLSIAGILTLVFMPLMGYIYEQLGSYDLGFYILTGIFIIGFIPSVLYEINLRKEQRRMSTASI